MINNNHELVGREGILALHGSPLRIEVVVLSVREVYGRFDYLVRPVSGDGQAWVQSQKVALKELKQ
jgi:hypothetical protein